MGSQPPIRVQEARQFLSLKLNEKAKETYLLAISAGEELSYQDYNQLAEILINNGEIREACYCYELSLEKHERQINTTHNLGYAYLILGDLRKAIANLKIAADWEPKNSLFQFNLGSALALANARQEAISRFDQAIKLDPENENAYAALGEVLNAENRPKEAEKLFKACAKVKPLSANAQLNLSSHLLNAEKFAAAVEPARKALRLNPNLELAHRNLATALQEIGQTEDAIHAVREGLKKNEQSAALWIALYAISTMSGQHHDAEDAIQRAFQLAPEDNDVRYNYGRHCLRGEDFRNGWFHYKARWETNQKIWNNPFSKTISQLQEWTGGPTNKALIAWPEQGIGDEIMFNSCIQDIYSLASNLTIVSDERLLELHKRSFTSKIHFISKNEALEKLNHFDLQVAMGNATGYVRQTKDSFKIAARGYLQADPTRTAELKAQLGIKEQDHTIGISWSSKGSKKFNTQKCMSPLEIIQLSKHPAATFISLEYQDCTEAINELKIESQVKIVDTASLHLFDDINTLAALIALCDEVVTVSNVNAHLAGALGVECTVVTRNHDWRWGRQGMQCYWYDSVSLLRQ